MPQLLAPRTKSPPLPSSQSGGRAALPPRRRAPPARRAPSSLQPDGALPHLELEQAAGSTYCRACGPHLRSTVCLFVRDGRSHGWILSVMHDQKLFRCSLRAVGVDLWTHRHWSISVAIHAPKSHAGADSASCAPRPRRPWLAACRRARPPPHHRHHHERDVGDRGGDSALLVLPARSLKAAEEAASTTRSTLLRASDEQL